MSHCDSSVTIANVNEQWRRQRSFLGLMFDQRIIVSALTQCQAETKAYPLWRALVQFAMEERELFQRKRAMSKQSAE